MTKWLWASVIVCLLASGCGNPGKNSNPKQRYTQNSIEQQPGMDSNLSDLYANRLNNDLLPVVKDSNPVLPTASPEVQQMQSPIPAAPSPPPANNNDLQASPSEAPKKPALPVQQYQGQGRRSGSKLTISQLVAKYPNTFKLRGSSKEKKVALTFDDGPDTRFTPKVLDALKANQVKATFFLLGSKANAHPDVVRQIVREGHVIGNHSYNHANLPKLSIDNFQSQIKRTETVLQGLIGYTPKLIRPPYGAINEEQVRWATDHHYLIVNWNVDSLDWKSLKSEQVLQNIMSQTRPGAIILQHSGGADSQDLSGTVQAIGPLISKLKAAGYTFVTVPELLHVAKSK